MKKHPNIGIAWYQREHYAALRELFVDGHQLPISYDQWLQQAERLVRELTSRGQTVIKADIDPQHFPTWCIAHELNIDSQARQRWASVVAAREQLDMRAKH